MDSIFLAVKLTSQEFFPSFLVLATCLFSFTALFYSISKRRSRGKWVAKMVDRFPGPPKYPVIGNIPHLFQVCASPSTETFRWIRQMSEKWGSMFRIWILGQPKIFITDADTAVKLLNGNGLQDKSTEVMEVAKKVGGYGLVAVPVPIHAHRRKMWLPSFGWKQLEYSTRIFREQGIKLRDNLEIHSKNDSLPFDFLPHSIYCTFSTICYSAFGYSYMDQLSVNEAAKEYNHDIHTISVNMTTRQFRPWLKSDFIFFCTPTGRETKKSFERGTEFAKMGIKARMATRSKKSEATNSFRGDKDVIDDLCFVNQLLDLHDKGRLSEEEVLAELNVFVVGGYDTSGITLCSTLFLLALHPEYQDRVLQEIYQVVGENVALDDKYEVTGRDVKQMKLMEYCIKETLRLYPTIPMSPRRATEDIQLEDGLVIPKGVDVYIPINIIHQDPKHFPEPEKFHPERFSVPVPSFMAFSMGSRNCIGQVYALQEIKVILCYLLLAYHWETTDTRESLQLSYQAIQVPANGVYFKIRKRVNT